MATATKNKPAPEAPKTAKQQVADALETYFSLENAVHATYLLDGEIEIKAAQEQLLKAFEDIELEANMSTVLAFIKTCTTKEEDVIVSNLSVETVAEYVEARMNILDADAVLEAGRGHGAIVVKTESLLQRNRLEEFLRTEIWTTDGLYNENVIL